MQDDYYHAEKKVLDPHNKKHPARSILRKHLSAATHKRVSWSAENFAKKKAAKSGRTVQDHLDNDFVDSSRMKEVRWVSIEM